ncbi:MAG: YlxM family DNA-binding protein [Oscillospiraceae bacterium]|nr:YlxM family DNA-binding protein [Oscillospiraceae bacterium]
MALLFDTYGALLTDKQRLLFDQYYNQDLSLGEIAENEGISRQGVHDAICRAESVLTDLEEKTGCVARARSAAQAFHEIDAAAGAILSGCGNPAEQAKLIQSFVLAAKE